MGGVTASLPRYHSNIERKKNWQQIWIDLGAVGGCS